MHGTSAPRRSASSRPPPACGRGRFSRRLLARPLVQPQHALDQPGAVVERERHALSPQLASDGARGWRPTTTPITSNSRTGWLRSHRTSPVSLTEPQQARCQQPHRRRGHAVGAPVTDVGSVDRRRDERVRRRPPRVRGRGRRVGRGALRAPPFWRHALNAQKFLAGVNEDQCGDLVAAVTRAQCASTSPRSARRRRRRRRPHSWRARSRRTVVRHLVHIASSQMRRSRTFSPKATKWPLRCRTSS